MRWRSVNYFAFVPVVFTLVMQGEQLYSALQSGMPLLEWRMIEPLVFCGPASLLIAATGYATAIKLASSSIPRALLIGCAIGTAWALVAAVVGNVIAQSNGAPPPVMERFLKTSLILLSIFVPLAVVLCVFSRWRARRLGVLGTSE